MHQQNYESDSEIKSVNVYHYALSLFLTEKLNVNKNLHTENAA